MRDGEKMPSIQFFVPGNPIPKQSFRYRKGGGYQPKRVREWEATVSGYALASEYEYIRDGDIRVELNFKRKDKRKCDLDNLSKGVLDACNKIIWADDKQITDLRITKKHDKENPGVLVTVWSNL